MAHAKHLIRPREEGRAYWILVLPALLIYLFVMAFPAITSVILSMSNYNGGRMFGDGAEKWSFKGFDMYIKMFIDPLFWISLKNNAYIVGVSIFGQIPLGFIFAYLLFRKLVRAPGFWQGILYMPAIISTIVIGVLWGQLFSKEGPLAMLINTFNHNDFIARYNALVVGLDPKALSDDLLHKLIALGGGQSAFSAAQWGNGFVESKKYILDIIASYPADQLLGLRSDMMNTFVAKWTPEFMNQANWAMIPVLFVTLWQWTGMYLIIFLANMQRIDTGIIEAGVIDGASEWQVLRHIILPSLSGVLVTTSILAISGSLRSFDLIYAMTNGGPDNITSVLSVYMYKSAINMGHPNYPLANAISTMMMAISLLLIAVVRVIEKRFGGKE